MLRQVILAVFAASAALAGEEGWRPTYIKSATEAEMAQTSGWVAQHFSGDASQAPFSFSLDGRNSTGSNLNWTRQEVPSGPSQTPNPSLPHRLTRTYTDAAGGFGAFCEVTAYRDSPAVEWMLSFRNDGTGDLPTLTDVLSADFVLTRRQPGDVVLLHADGSQCKVTDFEPHETPLTPGQPLTFAPCGGRSSDGVMPYFNVTMPGEGGAIVAIGWSGQWRATFSREDGGAVRVRAGMESLRVRLRPGERIRTPAILVMFYEGDAVRGRNLWRNLMLRRVTPLENGLPVNPPVAASGATIGFNNVTEANQIHGILNVAAHRLAVDYWWIDAGWFPGGFPDGVGNFDPDPARFPNGLRPVGEACRKAGLKLVLWFEPERVMPGTQLASAHPEWLLAPDTTKPVEYDGKARLLDLGNDQARDWLTGKVSGMIQEIGVTVYRHDCNIQPSLYWHTNEPAERVGAIEAHYIEGLYRYYDALLGQNPGLILDNCASGGRRLDFEMQRRCLPLWRTDYCWEPIGEQCATYGLSYWLPLHGMGAVSADPYLFRSGMGANISTAFDYYNADAAFWGPLAERLKECRGLLNLFAGDFYPLTPYSIGQDAWMAWQFDRPDLGQGMVQAFRRETAPDDSKRFTLRGLEPNASYQVRDLDGLMPNQRLSGKELMEAGIAITAPKPPYAVVALYSRNDS